LDQVEEYLQAKTFQAPHVKIFGPTNIDEIRIEHIVLQDYQCGKPISALVAI